MTPAAEGLKAELSRMDARDRAELAEFLLGSLAGEPDAAAEEDWNAELARSVKEIQNGSAQGIPAEDVFARFGRAR